LAAAQCVRRVARRVRPNRGLHPSGSRRRSAQGSGKAAPDKDARSTFPGDLRDIALCSSSPLPHRRASTVRRSSLSARESTKRGRALPETERRAQGEHSVHVQEHVRTDHMPRVLIHRAIACCLVDPMCGLASNLRSSGRHTVIAAPCRTRCATAPRCWSGSARRSSRVSHPERASCWNRRTRLVRVATGIPSAAMRVTKAARFIGGG
jgi:hypothetical protein